jgi:hypothetical protein
VALAKPCLDFGLETGTFIKRAQQITTTGRIFRDEIEQRHLRQSPSFLSFFVSPLMNLGSESSHTFAYLHLPLE